MYPYCGISQCPSSPHVLRRSPFKKKPSLHSNVTTAPGVNWKLDFRPNRGVSRMPHDKIRLKRTNKKYNLGCSVRFLMIYSLSIIFGNVDSAIVVVTGEMCHVTMKRHTVIKSALIGLATQIMSLQNARLIIVTTHACKFTNLPFQYPESDLEAKNLSVLE